MGEGTVFSLFVSSHLNGRGVPHPRSRQWGGPHPRFRWGVPHHRSWPPSQVLMGGVPHLADREVPPSQVWMGVPNPADSGGYPPSKIRMTPSPIQDWMRDALPLKRQATIVSTCYAASGVPLAFTQDDLCSIWIWPVHICHLQSRRGKRKESQLSVLKIEKAGPLPKSMHNWYKCVMLVLLILKYSSKTNIVSMVWFLHHGRKHDGFVVVALLFIRED